MLREMTENEKIMDIFANSPEVKDHIIKGVKEYYCLVDEDTVLDIVNEATARKLTYFKDILNHHYTKAKKFTSEVNETEYRKFMSVLILSRLCSRWSFTVEELEKVTNAIDTEAIQTNRLTQDVDLDGRVFVKGTKMTRFFTKLSDLFNNNYVKNNLTGQFVMQRGDNKELYLSISPYAFLKASNVGTCISPDGCNSFTVLANMGYPNLAVVHDEDFSWRAWLYLDNKNKEFALLQGYPRENFTKQIATVLMMHDMGYTPTNPGRFIVPGYHETNSFWIHDMTRGEEDFSEFHRIMMEFYEKIGFSHEVFSFRKEHGEIEFNYDASVIYAKRLNDLQAGYGLVEIYECHGCGENTLYSDDYCPSCEEDYMYCSECDNSVYEGDTYYSEYHQQLFCAHCYSDMALDAFEEAEIDREELMKDIFSFMDNYLGEKLEKESNVYESFLAHQDGGRKYITNRLIEMIYHEEGLNFYSSNPFGSLLIPYGGWTVLNSEAFRRELWDLTEPVREKMHEE